MLLKIINNEKSIEIDECTKLFAKSVEGEFEILPNHVDCMKILVPSVVKIEANDAEQKFAVAGGIFQLKNNEITIIADAVESQNEIDIERAKNALSRAENRLKELSAEVDARRAESAKARALARLKASMEN